MDLKYLTITIVLIAALPVAAQVQEANEPAVEIGEVRELRAAAEENPGLTETPKDHILQLYDGALVALESATVNRKAAADFERDRAATDRMVKLLRAEMLKPENDPSLEVPADWTFEQAEDALARERSRLAANRISLADAERQADERTTARTEISRRLGELDQELEELNDELRSESERYSDTDLRQAARTNVLARRVQARSEISKLRASLVLLEERGALIPLETDHAQRRVAFSQDLVLLYSTASRKLRRKHAQDSVSEVLRLTKETAAEIPELAGLASDSQRFAESLWGTDGVTARNERVTDSLVATRKHLADLNRIAELTRRKFKAYGQRGSVTRWWPDIPDGFPKTEDVAATVRRLEYEIPEVEHRLITLEQLRSQGHDLLQTTRESLKNVYGEVPDPAVIRRTRRLLEQRRDILDQLIQETERYASQLVEYRSVSQHFLTSITTVEEFLFANVLWVRSVPQPVVPRPSDIAAAAGWLFAPSEQRLDLQGSETGITIRPSDAITVATVLLVLFLYPRIRRRLADLADRVEDPARDSFRHSLEALVLTAFLASPLPALMFLGSSIFHRSTGRPDLHATAQALSMLAMITLLLESIRHLFAPRGLAEAHFDWPAKITRLFYRGLLYPELVSLPLLYIAIKLILVGGRLSSPQNLQLYSNSLGRVAFIVALLVLGPSILALLRPEKKTESTDRPESAPWSRIFSRYAFPAAFLVALPLLILATIVPAILAVFGYYLTAVLLAYQMLRTLLLGFLVLVGGGMVHRWRVVTIRRSMGSLGEDGINTQALKDVKDAELQVRQLFRFISIIVIAIGLFSIWSDALPLMQTLKRIQVWPRISVISTDVDRDVASVAVNAVPAEAGKESQAEADSGGSTPIDAMTPNGQSGDQTPSVSPSAPLTLWNLIEAILAGFIALILAKNLPGLVELFLSRRTTMDSGARVAFSTLVRYTITILGVSVVFGLLGITWSKIQWLAAALTFGLGFGLQEIVANFVSGLILLVERPVRVGDVVTIGNLMGKVTKIQIRATTITLWDRSEMIVPNKEFVTTKLVNWTLSDSKRRIEIPVRIAYGADPERVKQIMVDIAKDHPAVLSEPEPHALLLSFGDDAIHLELRFVVDFGVGLATKDQVQMSIDRAFKEKGIEFALPQRVMRVISESTDSEGENPGG